MHPLTHTHHPFAISSAEQLGGNGDSEFISIVYKGYGSKLRWTYKKNMLVGMGQGWVLGYEEGDGGVVWDVRLVSMRDMKGTVGLMFWG